MTSPRPQGELTVERMCTLAGVKRRRQKGVGQILGFQVEAFETVEQRDAAW